MNFDLAATEVLDGNAAGISNSLGKFYGSKTFGIDEVIYAEVALVVYERVVAERFVVNTRKGGLSSEGFGERRGNEIGFVAASHREEEIALFHACIEQCVGGAAVLGNHANIKLLLQGLGELLVALDDSDVMVG